MIEVVLDRAVHLDVGGRAIGARRPVELIGIEEVKALVEQHRIRDLDNPRFTNQSFLAKFGTHLV